MRYVSTRGQAPPVSFLDAVLAGMAPDGGLYVPEEWPEIRPEFLEKGIPQGEYERVAYKILKAFAGDSLTHDELSHATRSAYSARGPERAAQLGPFASSVVTPLTQLRLGSWMLELFHGPSLSFKDVANQLMGPLYDLALHKRDERLSIVCATSGDTGGAAVAAFQQRERVALFVLIPRGRASDVQRRFMTCSGAGNIFPIEIEGDFDACQKVLKALFADQEFSGRASLSTVNSINWARIAAQCVYFYTTAHLLRATNGVNFSVPTGNFGDAYSGWVAKRLGAPINRILVALNENDMLWRAICNGRFERAARSEATLSPAMDIQAPSNFERILYEALNRDGAKVAKLYQQFAEAGAFDVPWEAQSLFDSDFVVGDPATDSATLDSIQSIWRDCGYLTCPHTAVAAYATLAGEKDVSWEEFSEPYVILATAHPAKFPDTVERATGVRPQLPAKCADLFEREEKYDSLPADVEAVKKYIRERSRAWS